MPTALPRSKVKTNQTWNAESVFDSPGAFDAEVKRILESLPAIKAFQGRLAEGPATFIEAMNAIEALSRRAAKVQVYATMSSSVDATNQQGAEMNSKATSALSQVSAATSFVDPELLSIGEAQLSQWLRDDSRMKLYEHYFNDLFRKRAHVRNAEVEELLGMLRDPFLSTRNTTNMLSNADFSFKPARDSAGNKIELMADLFSEGFGGEMNLDLERVGITWGTFTTHLYIDFYSFQYAIGISAANAIAKRILAGIPNAAEDHINFLKAGSSRPPMEVFRMAGVDMTSTQPIEDAFEVLDDYIDRLESLTK